MCQGKLEAISAAVLYHIYTQLELLTTTARQRERERERESRPLHQASHAVESNRKHGTSFILMV